MDGWNPLHPWACCLCEPAAQRRRSGLVWGGANLWNEGGYAPPQKVERGLCIALMTDRFDLRRTSRPGGGGVQMDIFPSQFCWLSNRGGQRPPSTYLRGAAFYTPYNYRSIWGGASSQIEGGQRPPSKNRGGAFAPPVPMAPPPMLLPLWASARSPIACRPVAELDFSHLGTIQSPSIDRYWHHLHMGNGVCQRSQPFASGDPTNYLRERGPNYFTASSACIQFSSTCRYNWALCKVSIFKAN